MLATTIFFFVQLGSAALRLTTPYDCSLSLVLHIKLNGSANVAFRSTPSDSNGGGDPSTFPVGLALPPLPLPFSRPRFAFRPKLIGLRIGRLELFILCPAINQFLQQPNRGRKDRTATRRNEGRRPDAPRRTKRRSNENRAKKNEGQAAAGRQVS